MVKSLDEQIKSLQERQAQLKAREDDLKARRRERERKARTKRLIEVGAMAESAAGYSSLNRFNDFFIISASFS